jgi:transcriptional regulator with XRE-family HTH domain
MEIGVTIKTIRKQANMTQEELSAVTGLSQTSVSQIESGHKRPSKTSLKKICDALDVPEAVVYILALEDSDVPASRKKMFNKLYPDIKSLALQLLEGKK